MGRRRKVDSLLPVGVYRHGKRFRLRIYVGTQKRPAWHNFKATSEAEMFKEHMRYLRKKEVVTMLDVIERYAGEEIPKKAAATQISDKKALAPLRLFFGHLRPQDISPAQIVAYIDTRGREAPIRANREAAVLSHMFTKCRHWGILQDNPAQKLRYRNPEMPRTRYVTDQELRRALRMAPPTVRYVMWLCNLTGLRRADLLGLQPQQFTDDGLVVTLSKSRRPGAVPKRLLFQWTLSLERLYRRVEQLRGGNSERESFFDISTPAFERCWTRFQKAWRAEGNEGFQMKDIRAKYGTDLAERGGDPTRNLAHSSRATTTRHYQRRPIKISG